MAAFAGDPSHAPEWYVNIRSVEWKTSPPLAVGSKLSFVARFLGRRLAYTYEIVELSAERLVMCTAEGPFPMETTYAWAALDGGRPRMTLHNRGEPSGLKKARGAAHGGGDAPREREGPGKAEGAAREEVSRAGQAATKWRSTVRDHERRAAAHQAMRPAASLPHPLASRANCATPPQERCRT